MAWPTCPVCGGEGIDIEYGLPGRELFEAAERGEVALGGCVIGEDDPDFRCSACGHEWMTASLEPTSAPTRVIGFSPYVQEQLAYYVYLLSDPRDKKIFYVGKGKGNRIFAHARDALDVEHVSDKLERIREIRNSGHQVGYELLRFRLTEKAAFDVEAAAIQLLGLHDLTNLIDGHHVSSTGRMSVDLAISLFDAPPVGEITEPVLPIKIPRLWYPSIPAEELFEATAGWWRIGERGRTRAKYAFCIVKGVFREVFRIEGWRQRQEGDRDWENDIGKTPRWGFTGMVADELAHYRNHSVRHLYRKGDASPIRYINCD